MKLLVFFLISAPVFAQLTPDQKISDFRDLAAIYAKRYAPYEWKTAVFGFDLLDMGPWIDRVANSADDLDFYEAMIDYVSRLNDSHDAYLLPSTFSASLGFSVDIYDGKVLIDGISRAQLPATPFAFQVGDELVSVDGRPVEDLIQEFGKYYRQANPRSGRRRAASLIVSRPQSRMPHVASLGDSAAISVKRQSGAIENYTIQWLKFGIPLTQVGPVRSPMSIRRETAAFAVEMPLEDRPDFMPDLAGLEKSAQDADGGVIGYGSINPVFSPPAGFTQRLGKAGDFFVSGTFSAGGYNIGLIRIPTYDPANVAAALTQFETEIAYLQDNTDGLIVDQMRNPGGDLCYGENIVAHLIPTTFRPLGYEIRPTWDYIMSFAARLQAAQVLNLPQPTIDQYQALLNSLQSAYSANRGRTDAVPLCGPSFDRAPAKDSKGNAIAYSKPLIMLTDEFSTSTADSVPAMIQDNMRGLLVGFRTNGAGGSNSHGIERFQVGAYSEGDTGVTLSLMVRKNPATVADYPVTSYIENVGVQPDVTVDYMTKENLLNGGKTFLAAVVDQMVKSIQAGN
ncbi:MAG: S41 family peptidase [Acidobacteriota bacterium]|nr:S41 family peptidase [Acidobacteriota bacterium]